MQIKISSHMILSNLDIQFRVTRASGPGGQHVNKTDSAVQLHFNIHSPAITDNMRARLKQIAGNKISSQGVLILKSDQYRSQYRNKQDALLRLKHLLKLAATEPKKRRPTKPSRAVIQKRQQEKKYRAKKKAHRTKNYVNLAE